MRSVLLFHLFTEKVFCSSACYFSPEGCKAGLAPQGLYGFGTNSPFHTLQDQVERDGHNPGDNILAFAMLSVPLWQHEGFRVGTIALAQGRNLTCLNTPSTEHHGDTIQVHFHFSCTTFSTSCLRAASDAASHWDNLAVQLTTRAPIYCHLFHHHFTISETPSPLLFTTSHHIHLQQTSLRTSILTLHHCNNHT